jgi:hypothetical protein
MEEITSLAQVGYKPSPAGGKGGNLFPTVFEIQFLEEGMTRAI